MKSIIKFWENLFSHKEQRAALIPHNTVAGRSLVIVIAIMSFLASLTMGAVFLISEAAGNWSSSVSSELTVQIRPVMGKDIDRDVQVVANLLTNYQGLTDVRIISKKESERLLEPWLGTGLSLNDLPIPRLVLAKFSKQTKPNLAALKKNLEEKIPQASLDDHAHWIGRLVAMARTVVVGAIIILVLVLTAMVLAVSFVTNGTMSSNSEVINVLHFVGAKNAFIAKEFQSHFLGLGLRGGLMGGAFAAIAFLSSSQIFPLLSDGASGDQVNALFGSTSLSLSGYISIGMVSVLAALLTALASRLILMRHLKSLW